MKPNLNIDTDVAGDAIDKVKNGDDNVETPDGAPGDNNDDDEPGTGEAGVVSPSDPEHTHTHTHTDRNRRQHGFPSMNIMAHTTSQRSLETVITLNIHASEHTTPVPSYGCSASPVIQINGDSESDEEKQQTERLIGSNSDNNESSTSKKKQTLMSIGKKADKRCQLLHEGLNLSLVMDYPNCNRNTSIQICHSGNGRKHSNQSAACRYSNSSTVANKTIQKRRRGCHGR